MPEKRLERMRAATLDTDHAEYQHRLSQRSRIRELRTERCDRCELKHFVTLDAGDMCRMCGWMHHPIWRQQFVVYA